MYVRIPQMLSAEQLQFVDEMIAAGTFSDGAATAGTPTKPVKHNLQLDLQTHPKRDEFLRLINQVVMNNRIVRSAALPRRMTLPLISKYSQGMSYGWHIDNALMSTGRNPVRTDVACTIFLQPAADYDGGELMVRTTTGDVTVKLERGDAILYPASNRHQVLEVTRGERLAIVFWIQSMIADTGKREILHELEVAYDRIMKESPKSEAVQALQRAQSNLVRLWSELG